MNATNRPGMADHAPSGLLIFAGVIMATGATIGIVAPSLREAPWTDDLQQAAAAIAGNPTAYAWANGFFMAATVLTCFALVPISIRFVGRSHPWALTALVAYAFATVFEVIERTISMWVFTWAAQQDLQLSDPAVQIILRFQEGLDYTFYIFGFLAISLYGIAILVRPQHNSFGWLFIIGGIFGIVLELVGAAIPAMVFIGTIALGVAIWIYGVAPSELSTR